MKKDCGFWDINKNYIPDIQELNEIERKEIMETKNINEFFDELNDMANFKNFGEKPETEDETKKEFIQNFAIELTNTTLDERERIAEKYYEEIAELQQENASLKEEIEIRDNLSEKFRIESLSWANIANEYQKDKTKLEQTLQEIKAIAECVIDNDNSLKTDHCFGHCSECSSFEHCKLYPYWQITHFITKAEEE